MFSKAEFIKEFEGKMMEGFYAGLNIYTKVG